jgi:hypothetical protein
MHNLKEKVQREGSSGVEQRLVIPILQKVGAASELL